MKFKKLYAVGIAVLVCLLVVGGIYGYMKYEKLQSTLSRIYSGRAEERRISW